MSALGRAIRSVSPGLHGYLASLINGEFEIFPPRRVVGDRLIHKVVKEKFSYRPGFFIEAGANNGIRGSNTYYLERYCGWRGILVEAIPHRFVECKLSRPLSKSVHCALVSDDYSKDYVELVYMDLMSMAVSEKGAVDLDTHIQKSIETTRHKDGLIGTQFLAPARTLTSVLEEAGNPQVDFFSLDVEGHELDVLNGLDFDMCSPTYILVENWDRTGLDQFLKSKGYKVDTVIGEQDTLYKLGSSDAMSRFTAD